MHAMSLYKGWYIVKEACRTVGTCVKLKFAVYSAILVSKCGARVTRTNPSRSEYRVKISEVLNRSG